MKLNITRIDRLESVMDQVLRFTRITNKPSHWQVIGDIEGGTVELLNLLKFNTGLKLFVEEVDGNHVVLSTIRPMKEIGDIKEFHIRMNHWKYGRTDN